MAGCDVLNELNIEKDKKAYFSERYETLKRRGFTNDEVIKALLKSEKEGKFKAQKRLYAGMYDKMNYMCRCYMDRTARMALAYDFVPDIDALLHSVLCLYEMSPIMHSRFVNNYVMPYWKAEDYTAEQVFYTKEVDDLKEAEHNFLVSSLPVDAKIQATIALFTKGDECVFCLKWNHMVMDGVGCGQFVMDIMLNYARFKNGDYSLLDYRTGSRHYSKVYDDMPKKKKRKAKMQFANSSPKEKKSLPFTPKGENDCILLIEKEIGKDIFEKARLKGKAQGATANDIITAAFARAFYKITNTPSDEKVTVSCAVDLRRHIKDINSIGYTNHAAFMPCTFSSMGETMDETVKSALESTKKEKEDEFLGLHGLPLLNIAYRTMIYAQAEPVIKLFYNNANLAISNVGTIAGGLYLFDGHKPKRAFGSGGAKKKPCGFITTQSIGGRLNLIMSLEGNDEDKKMVEHFFDLMEDEMKEYALK